MIKTYFSRAKKGLDLFLGVVAIGHNNLVGGFVFVFEQTIGLIEFITIAIGVVLVFPFWLIGYNKERNEDQEVHLTATGKIKE